MGDEQEQVAVAGAEVGEGLPERRSLPGGVDLLLEAGVVVGLQHRLAGEAPTRVIVAPPPAALVCEQVERDPEEPAPSRPPASVISGGGVQHRQEDGADQLGCGLWIAATPRGEALERIDVAAVELLECRLVTRDAGEQR